RVHLITKSLRANPAPTFARFGQQNRYHVINAGRHCKKPKNGASSVSQTASNRVSPLYRNALFLAETSPLSQRSRHNFVNIERIQHFSHYGITFTMIRLGTGKPELPAWLAR
ncbi:hypothetical protein, partial [Pseudomonas carnis]|uniref:hypothetical protein n=2 Tax=Pseudomonas carnis TaxID=2487355 RepID=UPI001E62CC4D